MSTTWTRTATQICNDALEHMSVLGSGETANAGDMQLALKALDAVLKELPLSGFNWPQLSGEVALTFAASQQMALPTDYLDYPVAWKTLNGYKSLLTQIPHATWVGMADRTVAGEVVTHFYISPAKVFYLWPTPTVDPVVTLQYQKIVPDADGSSATALPQIWLGAVPLGVANELTLKFGLPQDKRVEIAQRWKAKRDHALAMSVPSEVISFSVAD